VGINEEDILKLLEYGVMHLKQLKALRAKEIKLDYYDRPKNITVKEKCIKQILKNTKSNKISVTLNSCK